MFISSRKKKTFKVSQIQKLIVLKLWKINCEINRLFRMQKEQIKQFKCFNRGLTFLSFERNNWTLVELVNKNSGNRAYLWQFKNWICPVIIIIDDFWNSIIEKVYTHQEHQMITQKMKIKHWKAASYW